MAGSNGQQETKKGEDKNGGNGNGALPPETELKLLRRFGALCGATLGAITIVSGVAWWIIAQAVEPQASQKAETAAEAKIQEFNDEIDTLVSKLQSEVTRLSNELHSLNKEAFQTITNSRATALEANRRAEEIESVLAEVEKNWETAQKYVDLLEKASGDVRDLAGNKEFRKEVAKYVLPANTVVASVRPCEDLGEGWVSFEEGVGRFIIGAGEHLLPDFRYWIRRLPDGSSEKVELSTYKPKDTDGEETHTLTIPEMPPHDHRFDRSAPARYVKQSDGDSHKTSNANGNIKITTHQEVNSQGGGLPHNNMPPYIALYFCKKK